MICYDVVLMMKTGLAISLQIYHFGGLLTPAVPKKKLREGRPSFSSPLTLEIVGSFQELPCLRRRAKGIGDGIGEGFRDPILKCPICLLDSKVILT